MPKIKLKNITKRFGNTVAVDNLNLTIADGEFVTLLGPSGCGKTTTLRMIAGLEIPGDGEIFIDDRCVFSARNGINVPPENRNVGFIFQNYALWPHMTVYKNISLGLENLKWHKDKIAARIEELLEMLHITDYIDRYPGELSGGQQQRVAIARTLATDPQVLFMDEPLSDLDAKLRMEMRTELKRLHVETDTTLVYVTHDQLEAMTLSSKICLMDEGHLQQFAPPMEVYHNPINHFVADFVGSPNINSLVVRGSSVNLDEVKLVGEGLEVLFIPVSSGISVSEDQELLLGIRPENIIITNSGGITGSVYSTLPSGMETIVKIDVNGTILTSVTFGSVDFPMGTRVNISFQSENHVIFDKVSGVSMASGRLL